MISGPESQPTSNKTALIKTKNEALLRSPVSLFRCNGLSAKVIEENILLLNAQVDQQFNHGRIHHWRPAHIELTVLWCFMVLEILLVENVVDKAGKPVPRMICQKLWINRRMRWMRCGMVFST